MKKVIGIIVLIALLAGCAGTQPSKDEWGPVAITKNMKLPDEYIGNSNIKEISVSYKQNASEYLKKILDERLLAGISEINSKIQIQSVNILIEIDSICIANKAATILAGIFVGDNIMHGTMSISDSETNKMIGNYTIQVELNYAGYSAFVDLEYRIAEKFVLQAMKLLASQEVIK